MMILYRPSLSFMTDWSLSEERIYFMNVNAKFGNFPKNVKLT